MRPSRHLVLFLRAPRLGRVKSRLAAGIGALAALRFYRLVSERLLRDLGCDPRWRCHLCVTPDRAVRGRRPWRVAAHYRAQGGGDLGERMARVFRSLPPGPAVIIGSDIPAMTRAHVAGAFAALGGSEAVLGPAEDGGYWLIGLRRRPRVPWPLLRDVRWSSPDALADTLKGLPRGMSLAMLETLEDVDDAAAYRRWLSARRASDAPAAAASAR
ncbi:MAG TPA: TIGR04282 family arsenosugar biosynthesis glycosyltransferase [Stellaceae bacterium]|nr:TIGR04282 family arsenosugar biosynthesis glycosyltransferase [Stellaceae bacterium]